MTFGQTEVVGEEIAESLFGGNILANRNLLVDEHGYSASIDDLGVTDLRYPGGSLTEYYFDISNPNSTVGTDSETGEVKSMIPISDFLQFADQGGHAVTLVLPTRHYLSDDSDENGDRYAEVDPVPLADFVADVVSGSFGPVDLNGFEIGNEYWGSGGMTSVEYGRVASEMIRILDETLIELEASHPSAADIDILIQLGQNDGFAEFDEEWAEISSDEAIAQIQETFQLELDEDATYNDGSMNFANVSNEIIINQVMDAGVFEAIDGVILHTYSFGEQFPATRTYHLQQMQKTWLEENPSLDTYVTEWNMRGFSDRLEEHDDYGLHQAEEMLNMMEEFIRYGVDHANVWPLIQTTNNALSTGGIHEEPNAPGMFFRMMTENLPGKLLLDFNPDDQYRTEAVFEDTVVHGFANREDLVLFVFNDSDGTVTNTDLDLNELITGFDEIELSILGVQDGAQPGSNESDASYEVVDPSDTIETGIVDVALDPYEVLQVVVKGYQGAAPLESLFGEDDLGSVVVSEVEPDEHGFDFPTIALPEEDNADWKDEETNTFEDVGDAFGLEWLIALLPLAALVGMVG